jgi:NADH:ubiquinone oxidoreductase subunit K
MPTCCLIYVLSIFQLCLNRHNILKILISFELVLITIILDFAITSVFLDDSLGLLIALFLFVIAGSETAIGLSLVFSFHKNLNRIDFEYFNEIYG